MLILIERLGYANVSCSDLNKGNEESGFKILCEEGVRFTHAYTPSTMSQAATVSALTGKYPEKHGVHSNGNNFLSARNAVISKTAVQKGYRTGFFLGGAPVLRRSGLAQGFEVFDDNVFPTLKKLYRAAPEVLKAFKNWQEISSSGQAELAVIYLNDLQFENTATLNSLGEARENSYESQLAVVDEAMGKAFSDLKRKSQWNKTLIVVAGLNGHLRGEDHALLGPTDLSSENTHVALFMKPPQTDGYLRHPKKVDANVSLVDIGATIFDFLGHNEAESGGRLPVLSLKPALRESDAPLDPDRLILAESDWSQWRFGGQRRISLRSGTFVYVHDAIPTLYNSVLDNREREPVGKGASALKERGEIFRSYLDGNDVDYWTPLREDLREMAYLGQQIWGGHLSSADIRDAIKSAGRKHKHLHQLQSWRAAVALKTENWRDLLAAGEESAEKNWIFVAKKNLGVRVVSPTDGCLRYLVSQAGVRPSVHDCESEEAVDLVSWLDETLSPGQRQKSMENFYRAYSDRRLIDKIAEQNYASGLTWDVPLGNPGDPHISDLILGMPEYRKYRSVLIRRLSEQQSGEAK